MSHFSHADLTVMRINQACRILLKASTLSRRSIEHVALCSSPSDRRVDQMSLSYLLKHSSWSRRSIEHVALVLKPICPVCRSIKRVACCSSPVHGHVDVSIMSHYFSSSPSDRYVNQSSMSCFPQAQLMVMSIHQTCRIVFMSI